jgi:polygalacturonase
VKYNHVKVLSFGPGGDGINPVGSRNVQITDCFLRCTDDCIAIKAPAPDHVVKNIVIADNTMLGFAYSDGVTIGYETNGPSVNQVMVRNCDILMARGGSRVEGHSGFSIICDGPAVISDILFENIRLEKSEFKLFELQVTDGTKYGKGPPGSINNITLKDVEWLHDGLLVIKGFDDNHRVSGVKFENCRVSGRPLSEVKTNLLEVNEFTDDIIINNKP